MLAPIVSSQDRRAAEEPDPVIEPAEHACSDGWLPDDDAGRRRPCPTCKPWLTTSTPAPPHPRRRPREVPARPAWCGSCDERTRLVEDDEGRPSRCSTCSPPTAITTTRSARMTRTAARLVHLPTTGAGTLDAWLQRVLTWQPPATLGRAAWRPQAICLAVWAGGLVAPGTGGSPSSVEHLAHRLGWSLTLVHRHLEVAVAAGLLVTTEAT
jgi:hypothetical protein